MKGSVESTRVGLVGNLVVLGWVGCCAQKGAEKDGGEQEKEVGCEWEWKWQHRGRRQRHLYASRYVPVLFQLERNQTGEIIGQCADLAVVLA